MERNREARRGTGAAMNGGLSRRRQRSSSLRDSPEEDGGMEMAEITRLRDRGSKKHRDRDRSSRSKRRRGERILHGSNKDDEGDDSSDESVDEEEDDEEDDVSVAVRLPPPLPPPNPTSSSSPLSQSNHQHHHHQQNRKSLPIKVTRTPPVWKADEMIGFSVPRKARSASTKRSHECWVSGGSGSGEQIPRQASTSPSRLSPASTTQISPSSSNASARKKMKQMSGSKHRPLKVSKSPSSVQEDIEIEVAEVLYGMTKQFQCAPKQETSKIDSRDTNGGSGNEAKSRISSPNSISPAPPASLPSSVLPPSNLISNPTSLPTDGPKRKKPRPLKLEEERPSSPGGLLAQEASNMEVEHQMKEEASSPRSEKNTACPSTANGGGSNDLSVPPVAAAPLDVQQESSKIGNNPVPDSKLSKGEPDGQNQIENQEEPTPPEKETPLAASDVNHSEETLAKAALSSDVRREEKFCIDLMAPPLGKLSPERDSLCDFDADHKSQGLGIETALKVDIEKKEEKAVEKTAKVDEMVLENKKVDNSMQEEFDLKKQKVKETTLDLQIDLEKPDKDSHSNSNSKLQLQKSPKFEPKQEKAAPSPSPSPPAMPMTIAGWPGSLPPFGYMGQVPSLPAVVPMDGTTGVSNSLQPPSFLSPQPRPKRCVTHGYIAQNIYYHQRISRMNPFWPAAAGAAPLYGAKPCNLSVLPSSDGKNTASSQDNKGAPVVAAFKGPPSKERTPAANNPPTEAAEKKQLVLQQMPQSGSTSNMLHGPTFIFPLNQQQAAAAAAVAAATTRSGASKSTPGTGNGALSSGASSSAMVSTGTGCGSAATMNLSFAGLPPNEPQYLAILQNNAYPFPIPAHVAGPPPFRGANPAQAMPFFNGPFFSSQMLHPSQLQQQQQQQLLGPQQPPHTQQQGHQHASTSSGSSSSQKHPQPLQAPGGGASGAGGSNHGLPAANQQQHLLPHQARRREGDKPLEDSPSSTDGRNCQAQKNVYAHNFAMPIHPQNFTLMSAAATAAALGGGGGHGDKMHMQQQQPQQNQSMKVELTSSQAFAMPFISFNGVAAAPGLDFSSMAQNHAIFQALPEASRHGYSQFATAAVAAAATAEAAQQKKTHPEDGKSSGGGDSISANTVGEEERRVITGSKAPGISLQHSFSFSKPDGGPPFSSMLGSGVMDSSSRTLGLIPAPANRSSGPASTTTSIAEVPVVNIPNSQQQQQQFLQLQKHQQQQMQAQLASMKSSGSSNSATVCSERLPAVSTVTKFPQALAGFPQAFIQGGNSSQSPQWKASITRAATTPAPPQAPAAQPVAKNNPPAQQQGRAPQQQSFPAQSHQTQISFCMNTTKAVPAGGTSNPPSSSASAIAIGSPPNSVSKSANGNPRASASVKLGSSAAPLSLPQQSSTKSCVSSSGQKSSPASNNRNVPSSILGHPHIAPPNSSTKPQQQQAQQSQKQQQPFPQAQFLFSNPYLQAQPPHSNAGGYHQRRPSELPPSQQAQQQQLNSTPGSSGMLPLGTSALTTDPAKAVAAAAAAAAAAANGMKGMPPPGFLHPAHLAAAAQSAASGAPHPLMPASFPYLSLPAVSLKPAADQKHAAGNDNSHACWQPEKR